MSQSSQELSEQQKEKILELFRSGVTDINQLTQTVFNNKKLKARDKQGKLVSAFLVDKELNPNKADVGEFTEEQKQLIVSEMKNGSNPLNIARLLFGNDKIQRLSKEWRAVQQWVANNGLKVDDKDDIVSEYVAPRSFETIVGKINRAVGINLDHEKLSGKYKQYVEKLAVHFQNSRLKRIMDSYEVRKDRQLFEDQFIRLVWDQMDLTAMELDLIMNICADTVSVESSRARIQKLTSMFDDIEDKSELKISLSDSIKTITDEYNITLKRISDNTKKLQGDRSERLKSGSKDETSLISLFQELQEEENRINAIRIAEMQKMAIEEEANRLETADEWMCRILGVSKQEVI